MEEPQSAQSAQSGKLLRYALRSGSKTKEEKLPAAAVEPSNNSATKRGRPASNMSKSVGVLDLSGKDKPAKPARRLSVPSKPPTTPAPKLGGNITPISEARSRRSVRSESPASSDVSRPTSRKKFNVLASPSYWLQQIKLSEAAAKHSISLGFFKLALEAGCESLQLRHELKSYVDRNELSDLEDPLKELLESKTVVVNEQAQVSETCSQVLDEGNRSSDDDAKSCSSTMGSGKLKPKSLNTEAAQVSPVKAEPRRRLPQKALLQPGLGHLQQRVLRIQDLYVTMVLAYLPLRNPRSRVCKILTK
ncbi:hypothetical protein D8674_029739 [Pyrus ussuriensis x Pyrus communis]|uniref:Uncharacterized protein n=1 Tax=Pyrus ussuriensis x Pyrus communis TaxID=2448454 RepID=A0A5N5I508_9ROSA|nr:hypothetical protein D8674_029739 [Pyrus ussuriensis x Pyrus communis]